MVELLCNAKADVNAYSETHGGGTPLFVAAHAGKVDAMKVLLKHGAKVDIAVASHGAVSASLWSSLKGK